MVSIMKVLLLIFDFLACGLSVFGIGLIVKKL